ncbi:MAG: multicopper oxidase domain-containing protein [Anaerolineae bacterium]
MNANIYPLEDRTASSQHKYEAMTLAVLLAVGTIVLQYFVRFRILTVYNDTLVGHMLNILRDSLVLFLPALVTTIAGLGLARRLGVERDTWTDLLQRAAIVSLLFAILLLLLAPLQPYIGQALAVFGELNQNSLLAGGAGAGLGISALLDSMRDVLVAQAVTFPLAVLGMIFLAWRKGEWPLPGRSGNRRRYGFLPPREFSVLVVALIALGIMFAVGLDVPESHAQIPVNNACTDGSPIRTYDVSAINVDITLNRFGDHDPLGYMYVLDQNITAVRAQEASRLVSGGLRDDPIQPLVIRANLGECLEINFTNQLTTGESASLHIHGLPFTVDSAAGDVGFNPDTMVVPGGTITYRWPIPTETTAEATYYMHSHGNSRQQQAHGLFGAVVIEPAGSKYWHPESTTQALDSGWEAIIEDPNGVSFREFVIIFHEIGDEGYDVLDKLDNPLPLIDPLTDAYRPGSKALNYRSEPFGDRFKLLDDQGLPYDKAHGYSSYAYGDPATPIPRSYLGEPTKTRLMHGGSEVFHVYHLHGGGIRWRRNPAAEPGEFTGGLKKTPTQNAHSTRLDSQGLGPSESFTLEHECGAGGCQQSAGDFLWHCHIGHHYVAGMWSFWRVFDTEQVGGLAVLPDRVQTAPPPQPVNSLGLIGQTIEGKQVVAAVDFTDPLTQISLEDWVTAQLPPQGVRLDDEDATVWDWQITYQNGDLRKPLVLGEPETSESWENYTSLTPGVRPEILFNPDNGRYTWPLFKPHLGKRPPFSGNGHSGAPWLGENGSATRPDGLCPVGAPNNRYYPITAIELPIQITDLDTDPLGMLYVLSEEKADILSGVKPAEPLVIRSNVGDCMEIILTSEQLDANHGGRAKVNLHNHFTQFDPQASDGVITGFSYEQSIRPYATEGRTLTAQAVPGNLAINVNHVNRLRPGIDIGIGLGDFEVEIRRIESINGNIITLDQPLINTHPAGTAVGVEFVRYNHYSDVDSGTVFFHDHVNFKNWDHGLFGAHIIEPAGSTYHDPTTGAEVRSGSVVDIYNTNGGSVGWGQSGSFREFFVALHNQNPATSDPSGATINLRAEPLSKRGGDTAYQFSSVTHGDPQTPIIRTYVGDPVVIRGLGVVERVGALRMSGHRFRIANFAQEGDLVDTMNLDISERHDVVLDGGAGGPAGLPGDYLYYSTIGRDFLGGAWGLMRVHDGLQSDLQVLPGRTPPPIDPFGFPQQTFTGGSPAQGGNFTDVCPAGTPVRAYDVSIFKTPILFFEDPVNPLNNIEDGNGVIYALTADKADIIAGNKPVEPLVLRVNDGECLQITLHNDLGERAGLNLGKLLFDPQGSYGAAVGYNFDSTVASGGQWVYRYYADRELGTSIMLDMANPAQGADGAFGALIVEPAGASYYDSHTGAPLLSGTYANILTPDGGGFREYVALIQDDDPTIGQSTMPYPTSVSGITGINYRAMPLSKRLANNPDPAKVFDSTVHGDPQLVFEAYTGDPMRYRFAQPWGEQGHVFGMEGHRWPLESKMIGSVEIATKSLRPGESFDGRIIGGAGGGIQAAGDYLFQDHRMPFLEAGLWGILRVYDTLQPDLVAITQPAIAITKTASAPMVYIGDTVSYTYTVSNPGEEPLHSVNLSDDQCSPANFTSGDANLDNVLDLTEIWTYTCSVALTTSITNTATVSGTDAFTRTVSSQATAFVEVIDPVIDIFKTASSPTIRVGETVTYTYEVSSFFGNDPLTNISIVDDKCSPVTFVSGDTNGDSVLDLDETWIYTCATVLTQTTTNTATATGTDSLGGTVDWFDFTTVNVISPSFTVSKTANPTMVYGGQQVDYTIVVDNTGDVDLSNIIVNDDLTGCTLAGPTGDGGTPNVLDTGDTWSFTCSVSVPFSDISNTAVVTATDPLGGDLTGQASAFVNVINPDIDVFKSSNTPVAQAGDTITYTYEVSMFVGDDPLSNIQIVDDKCSPITLQGGDTNGDNILDISEIWTYTCSMTMTQTVTNTVVVTGTDSLGGTVDWSDTITVDLIQPALQVTKQASAPSINVGETVTYTYTITNTGDTTLTGVSATDDKLGSITLDATTLAPGATATGTASYTVTEGDLPGPLTNMISASGTPPYGPDATATDTLSVDLTFNPAIQVTKQASVASANVGDTIVYTYTVTNSGDVTLTSVGATDDKLGSITLDATTLAPGATATGTASHTVVEGDLPGPITNTVTAAGTPPAGAPVSSSASASVDLTFNPAIQVTKQASVASANVGDTIVYTYTVTNSGDVTLTSVGATDDKLGSITLDATTLAPGATATGTASHTVVEGDLPGPITNTVTAAGTPPVGAAVSSSASASVDLTFNSAIQVTKQASLVNADIGQTITYTYTVTNVGDVTLTGVVATDDKLGAVTLAASMLAPGVSVSGTATHTVTVEDLPGPLVNTVTVTGTTPVNTEVTATASASVNLPFNATLQVTKQASVTSANVGETIVYTYIVTNTGDVPLANITAVDDKLGNITLPNSALLAPGATITGTVAHTVVEGDLPGPLVNTVTVTGTSPVFGNSVTASDIAVVDLTFNPGIQVVQQVGVADARVGETVVFTYTITNIGDVTLTNLTTGDPNQTLASTTLAPGTSLIGTMTHVVTAQDLPGPFAHTLTINADAPAGVGVTGSSTVSVDIYAAVYLPMIITP